MSTNSGHILLNIPVTQADLNAGDDLVNIISVTTTEIPTPERDEVITKVEYTAGLNY